jgi:acetyl-CoA carboxylase carboxyltransferase component
MLKITAINDEQDYCSICGKTHLKKVVWLEDSTTGELHHVGTECAAKLLKISKLETTKQIKAYEKKLQAEQKQKEAELKKQEQIKHNIMMNWVSSHIEYTQAKNNWDQTRTNLSMTFTERMQVKREYNKIENKLIEEYKKINPAT